MKLQEAVRNASIHSEREDMVIYASAPFTPESDAKYDTYSPYLNLDKCFFGSCVDMSNELVSNSIISIIKEVESRRGEQNSEASRLPVLRRCANGV